MIEILLALYLVCLLLGFILSICLVYQDILPYVQNLYRRMTRRGTRRLVSSIRPDTPLERSVAITYGIAQIGILTIDMVIIAISLKRNRLAEVTEVLVPCTVQLLCSTNVGIPSALYSS
jgi:hypothetical protein